MALILVVIQDTDEGPAVSIVTEPVLTTGEGQTHTAAQQLAIQLVNSLNAQTQAAPGPAQREPEPSSIILPGADPEDPFSFN